MRDPVADAADECEQFLHLPRKFSGEGFRFFAQAVAGGAERDETAFDLPGERDDFAGNFNFLGIGCVHGTVQFSCVIL